MAVTDSRTPGYLVPSSTDISEPTDHLRKFVSELTGLDLKLVRRRWIRQVGTQPSLDADWASVGIDEVTTWATPESFRVRGDIEKPATGYDYKRSHQTLSVSVWFHGENAHVLADTFREGAHLNQNIDRFKQLSGLVIQSVDDDVRHLPDFIHEQWIDRYEVRMKVGRAVNRIYGVRTLARVGEVIIHTDYHVEE